MITTPPIVIVTLVINRFPQLTIYILSLIAATILPQPKANLATSMVESSDNPSLSDRIQFWRRPKTDVSSAPSLGVDDHPPAIGLTDSSEWNNAAPPHRPTTHHNECDSLQQPGPDNNDALAEKSAELPPPPAPPPPAEDRNREEPPTIGPEKKANIVIQFWRSAKAIIFSSWLNSLLVFVPVAIAVELTGVNPTVVFAMNAIAIIPLAGLLSIATESVASRMGDTIGALMNVTFGNVTELIILYVLNNYDTVMRTGLICAQYVCKPCRRAGEERAQGCP